MATTEKFHRLEDDVEDVFSRLTEAERKIIEHETRLSNGREVIDTMKKDIESLKPKAPDWLKLLGTGVTLLVMVLGAHYWIIDKLNDRPTAGQLEKIMVDHGQHGHVGTRDIRDEQIKQRVQMQQISQDVSDQGEKLDEVLTRLPPKRRR